MKNVIIDNLNCLDTYLVNKRDYLHTEPHLFRSTEMSTIIAKNY